MNRTALVALALLAACIREPDVDTDKDTGTDDTSGETGPVGDADGDGYTTDEGDCDDADATAFPGNVEVCDEVDQDCDGQIDEGTQSTYYRDADGDGFGDPSNAVEACEATRAYVVDATDCDDSALDVNPGAAEFCDGVDDDCDSVVDNGVTGRWFADADGDGFGDASTGTDACEQPDAHVGDATDCDDSTANAFPGNPEVCDEIDNDCNGTVDEGVTSTWFVDLDGDGYGEDSLTQEACAGPEGYAANADDCDDGDAGVGPAEIEVCDGVDQDCDGSVDEDAVDTLAWYADADGDDYGDAAVVTLACDEPMGSVSDATDCDDADATVYPDAADAWYDGIDQDCDGADDYDADGDGDAPEDHGGTDCDDADPARYGGVDCRPDAGCTHPSVETLAASDPSATSDLTFDATCGAWVSSLVSGVDYVYGIDAGGAHTVLTGTSTHNIGALALDPLTGTVVVSYNNVGYLGVQSGSDLPVVATGGFATGTNWANGYLNQTASSITMDAAGCVWVPNWSVSGTVDCLTTAGVATTLATFESYVESVALAPDEAGAVYVSVGADVYTIDTTTGAATLFYTFGDIVLDMVFDYQGDLYVETTGDELRLLEAGAATDSTFTAVSGDGKLAISPDGYLVRVQANPISASSYAEWALGD